MTDSKFKDWIRVNTEIIDNYNNISNIKCPNCKMAEINYQYVGDTSSRVGFLDLWCNACLQGIHISRTKVPEHISMISFDDVNEYKRVVPKFTVIEPF
ncbi:hypothetical protein J2T16_003272 [Paenibacillus intestini]|nr:hypothetical protein [Paenibacillus intestini]